MKYTTTITAIAIHPEGSSPIYGESLITISLDDDGAGQYLTLRQDENSINLDIKELAVLVNAANRLINDRAD